MKGAKRLTADAACCGALLLVRLAVAQTPLVCGTVQSNSIAVVGERDVYLYTAAMGEVVSIRMTALTDGLDTRLELRDSSSNLITSAAGRIDRALPEAGDYLIIALDQGDNDTGDYALTLQRLVEPCNAAQLVCGELAHGAIDAVAEVHSFTFPATASNRVLLKLTSLADDFDPTMEVFDPMGNPLTSILGATRFAETLTEAGTYSVLVRHRFGSSSTGAYSLYFQNLSTPCESLGVIPCGGLVAGLQLPNQPILYSFTGTEGDVVALRVLTTAAPSQDWEMYTPDGNVEVPFFESWTARLGASGEYFVVLFPPAGPPQYADYTISLNTVRDPCAAVPLVCGALQAGVLAERGEIHAYTLVGTAGEVINLHVASATEFFDPAFDLYDPDGVPVDPDGVPDAEWWRSHQDLTPALPKSGSYTVLVHWRASADSSLGEYRLLFRSISEPCDAKILSMGVTIHEAFSESSQTALYTFTAGPGPITLCSDGSDGGLSPFMELFTVTGELAAQGTGKLQPTLTNSSTYRLLLTGQPDFSFGYFLNVSPGAVDCPDFPFGPPSARLLEPAAGEFVLRGGTYRASWTVTGADALVQQEIWLSQDGGETFTAVATNLPANARSYDWAVPAGASAADWKLRIIATETNGLSISAETEGGFFVIDPQDQHNTVYEYDVLNQLVSATYAPDRTQYYAYDAALNRAKLFGSADPNTDTDGDGMPDAWEIAHDLDPGDPDDGTADSDSDGMTNYAESVACTDPQSPASVFAISNVFRGAAATHVTFHGRVGRAYIVEWTSNLLSDWVSLPPVMAASETTTITNASDGTVQFYRVRVEPGQPCE